MAKPVLALLSGADVVKLFELQAGENLIGRSTTVAENQQLIDLEAFDRSARVSHKHALVTCAGESVQIRDLNSLNGTIINKTQQLNEGQEYQLQAGDMILIGRLLFEYRLM